MELSGIATSVSLVTAVAAGAAAAVGPLPVLSSRFGEPVPGLVTLLAWRWPDQRVGHGRRASPPGVAPRISAAAPATCGAAIDVPLIVLVAVSLVIQAEVMFWPGAKMSVQVPKLENEARASVLVVAPTVIASATRAGVKLHALALELPAAIA